jgi:hypothetical protein
MRAHAIQPGHILTGALFSEPMRVETVRAHGSGVWEVDLVGVQSERFPWHEVSQVQHYWLEVDALTQPMQVREEAADYRR